MERLHGPIHPCLFGEEHLDVDVDVKYSEQETSKRRRSLEFSTSTFGCEAGRLEDKMPLLEMLQSSESCELMGFQALLTSPFHQFKKPWGDDPIIHTTNVHQEEPQQKLVPEETSGLAMGCSARLRKKRKRTKRKLGANKEEVESHRMTHIAVERNRRRQMNQHLTSLRSLMPPSYIHRGDQASIIGGAIDFVKELEQLLQSLQAQKILRKSERVLQFDHPLECCGTTPCSTSANIKTDQDQEGNYAEELTAERRSEAADVKARVIQNHVNLKVECPKRPGQGQGQRLIKAIVALEDLCLTVLHLNITSLQTSLLYSFNLKIEDGCVIGSSAEEIAVAVHQVFSFINATT